MRTPHPLRAGFSASMAAGVPAVGPAPFRDSRIRGLIQSRLVSGLHSYLVVLSFLVKFFHKFCKRVPCVRVVLRVSET